MLNRVVLQVNLVTDPETKALPSGAVVAEFRVAHNAGKDKAYFFSCKAFEKTAAFLCEHFKKGSPCLIEGRLTQRSWESDGKKNSVVEIQVDQVHFCGGKREEEGGVTRTQKAPSENDVPF